MKKFLGLIVVFLATVPFSFAMCPGSAPAITSGPSASISGLDATISWNTDSLSTSEGSYGDLGYTNDSGSVWIAQDQSVGVTSHSIVFHNALLTTGQSTIQYWVTSRCIVAGTPSWALIAQSAAHTFALSSGGPTITAGQLVTALGSPLRPVFPVYDGVHPGYQVTPGQGFVVQFNSFGTTLPSSGYVFSDGTGTTMNYVFSGTAFNYITSMRGWSSGGAIFDGGSLPTSALNALKLGGQCNTVSVIVACGNVDFVLSPTTPTGGANCTNNGGIDLGGGRCAYTLVITETSGDTNCIYNGGSTLTCNTATASGYVIANSTPALPVGPGWAGEADIPCRTRATMFTDNCQCLISSGDTNCTTAALCPDIMSSTCYYSYESLIHNNPAQKDNTWAEIWGLSTYHFAVSGNPNWFYEACHVDHLLAAYTGQNAQWNNVSQYCLHTMRDIQQYPPTLETVTSTNSFTVTGNGAPTQNAVDSCATILTNSTGTQVCATYTVPTAATLSGLVSGLASGYQYLAVDTNFNSSACPQHCGADCQVLSAVSGTSFTTECVLGSTPGTTDTWTIVRLLSNLTATAGTTGTSLVCSTCDFAGMFTISPTSGHAGTSYAVGDVVTITAQGDTATVYVVNSGAVVSLVPNAAQAYVIGSGLATTTGGSGSGLQVDISLAPQTAYIVSGVSNEWDGIATSPGAKVSSVNVSTHTVTLSSSITGLASSSVFQIRTWIGPGGGAAIYNWPIQLQDVWNSQGDYISLDMINLMSVTDNPGGIPALYENQRELAIEIRSCQIILDIRNTAAGTLAAQLPSSVCTDPVQMAMLVDAEFSQIDWLVNNSGNSNPSAVIIGGNGTNNDTFLSGVQMYSVQRILNDPLVYSATDPRGPYWIKTYADYLYVNGYSYVNPACGAYLFHEWAYEFESPHMGLCTVLGGSLPINVSGTPVQNVWSEQALIWPAFAWLCNKTGAALIPTTSVSYCAAFNDMFRYGTVYSIQAIDSAVAPGPKTIGQMGLWMFGDPARQDAFDWMTQASVLPGSDDGPVITF
jgi:hypothetical protein